MNEGKKFYDLSHPQSRIWIHELKFPGSNTRNIFYAGMFKKKVDLTLLEKAINLFIKHNDSTRIRITNKNGEIKQYFADYEEHKIEYQNFAIDNGQQLFDTWINQEVMKPLGNYDKDLFKFYIITYPDGTDGFINNFHHVILDGYAGAMLVELIVDNYYKLVENPDFEGNTTSSYKDYLQFREEYKESKRYNADREFWKEYLTGIDKKAFLKTSITNKTLKAMKARYIPTKADDDKIRKFCADLKITPFLLYIANLYLCFTKLAGTKEIMLGDVFHGRAKKEHKDMVAMLVNTVPFRMNYPGESMKITDLLQSIGRDFRKLARHIYYPFELLTTELKNAGIKSENLFNVLFNYKNTDFVIDYDWHFNNTEEFPIHIILYDEATIETLQLDINYLEEIYSKEEIDAFHNYFFTQLMTIVDDPEQDLFAMDTYKNEITDSKLKEFGDKFIAIADDEAVETGDFVKPASELENEIAAIWQEVLGLDKVGVTDNFFDVGGNSISVMKIAFLIKQRVDSRITVTDLFTYTTISAIASYLSGESNALDMDKLNKKIDKIKKVRSCGNEDDNGDIAIIGLSMRVPGADNKEQFWKNLVEGVESLTEFTMEEVLDAGIPDELANDPDYVRVKGILPDLEYFDSGFFDYFPNEVDSMDPQLRLLHECTYHALEDAGYVPQDFKGDIGSYLGGVDSYIWHRVVYGEKHDSTELYNLQFHNESYIYSTLVSYKLNLKGPSFTFQCACSTSLVAIHHACRALQTGDCDMAVAGGSRIWHPVKKGYLYEDGMIMAKDGHCRAFDADASGTVFSDGAGVVVLKKLNDAIRDNDNIYAVIKSTAVNNDGNRKVGLTATSVLGQAEVIRTSIATAGLTPEDLSYVEAHGTGTSLGDPAEVNALKLAFGSDQKQFCALSTVKGNIGHLDLASGVTGLIKTSLSLQHRQLPPLLHYKKANPEIDFENSPFKVVTELTEWDQGDKPLYAGLNNIGMGGTNAFAILTEAPKVNKDTPSRKQQMFFITAKTKKSMTALTESYIDFFENNPDTNLPNACYTLQKGRRDLRYRQAFTVSSTEELLTKLKAGLSNVNPASVRVDEQKRIVFLFPGQGNQYSEMAKELYEEESYFSTIVDECFAYLKKEFNKDYKQYIYPETVTDEAKDAINDTAIAQIVIFIVEYALAKMLIHWGLKPDVMMGHSLGEYTAACVAGVFSVEDCLKLLYKRAELMMSMERGVMLNIFKPENEVKDLIGDDVDISLINSSTMTIVSGEASAIEALEETLEEQDIFYKRLKTSHAFHSRMMEPMLADFTKIFDEITSNKASIPFISNTDGTIVDSGREIGADYWCEHLRNAVRFTDGLDTLFDTDKNSVFIEVGPGYSLSGLLKQHDGFDDKQRSINTVKHPKNRTDGYVYFFDNICELWLAGVALDYSTFYENEDRYTLSLPHYAFDKQRHWPDKYYREFKEGRKMGKKLVKRSDVAEWLYIPQWALTTLNGAPIETGQNFVIFLDDHGIGNGIAKKLLDIGHKVCLVTKSNAYAKESDTKYSMDMAADDQYKLLFKDLDKAGFEPDRIILMPNIRDLYEVTLDTMDTIKDTIDLSFYSLLNIAKNVSSLDKDIQIISVTNDMSDMKGMGDYNPDKSIVMGAVKAIPAEYRNMQCVNIDISLPQDDATKALVIDQLTDEANSEIERLCRCVAYREYYRYEEVYQQVKYKTPEKGEARIKQNGVYFITGGMGGIGLTVSEDMAKKFQPKLILTGRTLLPPRDEWDTYLEEHKDDIKMCHKILKVRELESKGAEVLVVKADAANLEEMQAAYKAAIDKFGRIDGLLHTAGVPDGAVIQLRDRATSEKVFSSKLLGTLILDKVFKDESLDFIIYCSSISAVVGYMGQSAYTGINTFLDYYSSYTRKHKNIHSSAINWDTWQQVGMALFTVELLRANAEGDEAATDAQVDELMKHAIMPHEGRDAFYHVLGIDLPRVVVCTRDLDAVIEAEVLQTGVSETFHDDIEEDVDLKERPELSSDYAEPTSPVEKKLVYVWERFFGIDQLGIDDNFFELGGDSIKAMQLITRLKKAGISLNYQKLFESSTIRELAPNVDYKGGDEEGTAQTTAAKEEAVEAELAAHEDVKAAEKVGEDNIYPLSSAQKRVYILSSMNEKSIGYNIPLALKLDGPVDYDRLRRVIDKLIARHESIRTGFINVEGQIYQKVHDTIEYELDIIEVSKENVLTEVQKFIRPFDINGVPLFRMSLLKENEQEHVLLIDMHHIISDGVSFSIFFDEFAKLYAGERLPALKYHYKDYALRQRTSEYIAVEQEQEAFWLKKLEGKLPVLNMPLDYPRPRIQQFDGDLFIAKFRGEPVEKLRKMAREKGVTLYMLLFTAYNVLIHKYTQQEDIIIGTPVAGRNDADFTNTIGMFVNSLAMRNTVSGERTFEELLNEIKQTTFDAFNNQDCQFDKLVEKLNLDRDTSRSAIFDIMFSFQPLQFISTQVEDLKINIHEYEQKTARFDISASGYEVGDNVDFLVTYSTSLYKPETIKKMFDRYVEMTVYMLDNPTVPIKDIDLISTDEREWIINEVNNTAKSIDTTQTLVGLFEAQAAKSPAAAAVFYEGNELSYQALNEQANYFAGQLHAQGIKAGDVVGLLVERSAEMFAGIMGILKAGGTYLPIDPAYPQQRVDFMLSDSGAKVLLTNVAKPEGLEFSGPVIDLNQDGSTADNPALASTADDGAYIIYTSGSTGKPKGVLVNHANVVNLHHGMDERIFSKYDSPQKMAFLSPAVFDASVKIIFPVLALGHALYVVPEQIRLDGDGIIDYYQKHGIDLTDGTPGHLRLLAASEADASACGVKHFIIGGETLKKELVNEIYNKFNEDIIVTNVYGPTECTVVSTAFEVTKDTIDTYEKIPIGTPLPNAKAFVVDEAGKLQPVGMPGELWIAGSGVTAGYINRPKLNEEKFVSDFDPSWGDMSGITGAYRSGDLVRMLTDGQIEFMGRIDDQIKVRGFRIEPGEIENKLLSFAEVKEAVVVPVERNENTILCAYYTADGDIDKETLRSYLRGILPDYMVPVFYTEVERFTLTDRGKINIKALPDPEANIVKEFVAPKDELESTLTEIWKEVLGIDKISVNETFFNLGGNSLGIMKVVSLIKKRLNADISVIDLFNYTTISMIAGYLTDGGKKEMSEEEKKLSDRRADSRQNFRRNTRGGR